MDKCFNFYAFASNLRVMFYVSTKVNTCVHRVRRGNFALFQILFVSLSFVMLFAKVLFVLYC